MKIYLKINQRGEPMNVFTSLGFAIADIEVEKMRLAEDTEIETDRLTEIRWKGRDGKTYVRRILVCDSCENPNLDYMMAPREVSATL